MLNIDNKDQEEFFKILESNDSSNSLEDDFSSSSNSCYQSVDDSSDSPNIKIGCEIHVVMLLTLLILSLRVKKTKN